MLTRLRQVAFKAEGTEGTAETLTAAEAKLLVYEPKVTPQVAKFERKPASSSLSLRPSLRGERSGTIPFRLEMRGSGTANTAPAWAPLLKSCGFIENTGIEKLNVGTITGTFTKGETVTGGTSSATGRVLFEQTSADGEIIVETLSGTWNAAETITGGSSGATCSTNAAIDANYGVSWQPGSGSVIPSGTLGIYTDGSVHRYKGCRGNVSFGFNLGEPGFLNFEFMGVDHDHVDGALLDITHETAIPPVFLQSLLKLDDYSPVFTALEINMNNVVSPRRDAGGTAEGIKSFLLTDRAPNGTCDPEQVLIATQDFWTKLYQGTQAYAEWQIGSVAGNRFRMAAPYVQYDEMSDDETDARAIAGLTLSLAEGVIGAEDEIEILHYQ